MVKKYENYIYLFAILGFIIMSIGLTYSYFVYDREIVYADLTAGSIGIDFVGERSTLTSADISTRTIGEGKVSEGLDFEITATADTEEILYEVELAQTGLTNEQLDNVKIYLTDQNNTEILGVYSYNELIDSKKNNGKMLYQVIVEGNSNGTSKTTNYPYRLRVWIDDSYQSSITSSYRFDVYVYAVNIEKEDYRKLTFNSDDDRGVYTFKYVETGEMYGDFPDIDGVKLWKKGEDTVTDLTSVSGLNDITIVAEWNLSPLRVMKKDLDTETTINFGNVSSASNGEGVYILPGTESDANPIYYYRGAVTDNNVIFGDYCWQIVRTTDTGGIKMIYNGVVTGTSEEPTCENAAHADRIISSSAFNSSSSSMSDVGYMSNKRYAYKSGEATSGAYFGSGISYDDVNNVYTLTGTSTTKDASHHYTCNNTNASATCSTVRYYYYGNYYINLTGGEDIEDAIYKMTGNGTAEVKSRPINQNYVLNYNDSTAKTAIETWFRTNLTNEVDNTKTDYRPYLEDTIYCNDRSFQQTGNNTLAKSGWNPNAEGTSGNGGLTTYIFFNTFTRFKNNSWYSTTNVPTTTCPNETDRFTVSSTVAHLNYPVGLLTADEIVMAGASGNSYKNNQTYYLYTGGNYWSSSPNFFDFRALEFIVNSNGYLDDYNVNNSSGLRPVVSLKPGIEFEDGGEGTALNPYVVKENLSSQESNEPLFTKDNNTTFLISLLSYGDEEDYTNGTNETSIVMPSTTSITLKFYDSSSNEYTYEFFGENQTVVNMELDDLASQLPDDVYDLSLVDTGEVDVYYGENVYVIGNDEGKAFLTIEKDSNNNIVYIKLSYIDILPDNL